jgi:peroxiredoxin
LDVDRFGLLTKTRRRKGLLVSPTPNRISRIVASAVVCALFSLVAQPTAQQSAPQPTLPDVQKLGPQVGTRVPDFTLLDQKGQSRTLASLTGPKGLMLVFYRSADWCPYCKTQLAELQTRTADLAKNGIGLAAVSYDAVPILADFSKRRGITFPLLSDPGSATIKRYGILNTTVPETNQQSYGIPFPGTFILSTQGVVTSRFFEQAYQERSTVGSIMARLGNKVEVQATAVSSPQLELTSFATDSTVAPGTQFSLVLDVRPAPRVHVYAPGVTGYKPIALVVEAQPGLVTRVAQYPVSEDYHFKPLNEHVQVYQRPFRIVQDLLIDPSPQGLAALKDVSSLTITGVLNYQACDDRGCFLPQSVRLKWTVTLRQLDRERAKP